MSGIPCMIEDKYYKELKMETKNHKLPNLLRCYSNSNFITRQRAKFLFYLCVALMTTVLLLISFKLYFRPISNSQDPSHFTNLIPIIILFLLFVFYLFLLIRGHYKVTSIVLPITILGVIWFIMVMDENQLIARIDTIVYVFMVLSVLPLLIQKRNYIILLTAALNVLALVGFTFFFKNKLGITDIDFWDYIIDNSVAITFVGFVGFYLNKTYIGALEQAQTDLQKRVETEKALMESEAKYKEITESLPEIVFEIDLKGRITYINLIGLKKIGYSPDEMNNLFITDFIVEKETLLQNIEKILLGEINTFKYTVIQKDGKKFPFQVYSSVIIKNGQPVGLRGIAIDLTNEIKAQKNIQESEERFFTAFKFNPAPMAISEIDTGLFIDVNDKWIQLIGYSREEHIGRTSQDLNYWFDNNDRLNIVRKLQENGFFKNEIVRVKTKSGVQINVRWSVEIITLNDKKVMLSLCSDETEKLKTEAELRESEERFSVSFKSSPASLIISEIETGRIMNANDKWVEMIGYSCREQIGKTTKEFGIFAKNEDRENLIKKLKVEGFLKNEQVNFITKSGERIIAKWSAETITLRGEKVLLSLITDETEKVRAEEALIASESKLKETLLLLPQTVYEADLTGQLTYINKAGTDMFGYRQEDIVNGLNVMDTIASEDHKNVKENIGRLLQGDITHGNQYMGKRKDGRTFPMQIYSRPIIKNGKAMGFRGVIFDLTQIKKVENELRQSNTLFKTLIESSPISITLSDLQGKIILANNVFSKYAAQPLDYIIGKTAKEIGIKTDFDDEKIVLEQFQKTGYIKNFETYVLNHKGEKFFMLFSAQIVTFNGKKGILQTSIDISDRRKAELELEHSQKLFKTLIDSNPSSITLIDSEGKYAMVNKAFANHINYDINEIIGKTPEDLGIEIDPKGKEFVLSELYSKGYIYGFETHIKNTDGRNLIILIFGSIVEVNNTKSILLSTVDITERKHLENELKKYNEQLEFLVKERTEELETSNEELRATNEELFTQREHLSITLEKLKETQEQLIQTEKMASLGLLTAGVAHEINNPINYIYNGTVAIENFLVDNSPENLETLKPLFEAINTGIQRVTSIVKSLNKYSRKDETSYVKCNMHEIIDNALAMLYNQYKKRIQILKEYSDIPPIIFAREGEMHQVFLNILTNAIQAIDDKGTVVIRTKVIESNVEISVKDTGIGIHPENLKKIFDPFFTTKDPGKGTGLGLSITNRIILGHKGSINCYSEPFKGTEFVITLPQTQEK